MKQTLEEAVNEIGGVHPDWDKITCFRIGFLYHLKTLFYIFTMLV